MSQGAGTRTDASDRMSVHGLPHSFDPVPYTEGVTDMDEWARVNKAKDKKKRTERPSSPVRKLPKFEEPPKDPDGGAVGA